MPELTLSVAIEEFLSYQKTRKNRPKSTIDTYRSTLAFFLRYAGDIPISKLTVRVVDSYARHLEQFNFAPKTYYNKLTPIRSMVKYLYSKDLTNLRPESIDLPTLEDTEANFLTPEEQVTMLKACKSDQERAIFLTLTRSGARVSELINLRTEDLFEGSVIIRRGKGGKSRIAFIAPDAADAIQKYHSSLKAAPEYLLCGRTGKQLSRQYVYQLIKRVAERSGITKEISPHTMRHTCGTNLLMNGMSIQDVQKILGHKNIQTTLIYMHFTNDYLKGEYEKATSNMLMTVDKLAVT